MADPVSHDQNFKNLIVDYPRKALEFFAPEEAPRPEEAARASSPVREERCSRSASATATGGSTCR